MYKVHYGLVDAGFATLEVKETTKNINGRKLLHVVGKGKSISAFDLFFKVRDRYESYIDQEGMFPWIFIRRVYEGGFEIKQDYTFYQHKKYFLQPLNQRLKIGIYGTLTEYHLS